MIYDERNAPLQLIFIGYVSTAFMPIFSGRIKQYLITIMNPTLPERIFLCGFMGAGKSTIGRGLAPELELPFHDLDTHIEQLAGQSISEIFQKKGEQAFRQRERSAVIDIIRHNKGIIALGGGTLQSQHLLDHIKVNGLLVFIDAPLKLIMKRIKNDKNRPMLLNEQGELKSDGILENELSTLLEERRPFYEQSEVTITPANFDSAEDIIEQLVKKIKYHVALY
jgi:shikimate kinase